ncbi:MAG: hypothetical protein HYU57_02235 [Micavibrio aeruginosavorus]|nr:hypothetical protein [Micavibrio aeruginosavorus]
MPLPDDSHVTPFEKHRVRAGISIPEMAAQMYMPVEEYEAMDQGRTRPVVMDIIAFCEILGIHPVDLCPEPPDGAPLPRTMRDTLMAVEQAPGQDPEWRNRARERLKEEVKRADKILSKNIAGIAPLLSAFGFSRNLKTFNAPLYDLDAAHDGLLQNIIEGGRDNLRGVIEAYLNAHQLALEEEFIFQAESHRRIELKREKNKEAIKNMARFVYGESGHLAAIDRLKERVSMTDDLAQLRATLVSNPWLLGKPLVPDTDRRQSSLILMLHGTWIGPRLKKQERNQYELMVSAQKALADFCQWRGHPRTQRLIDWIESWLVLDNHLKGGPVATRYLVRECMKRYAPGSKPQT